MMNRLMRFLLLPALLISTLFALWPATPAFAQAYREIRWEDLTPKHWDPMAELKDIDFAKLDDADPRAAEALEKLRRIWDEAPPEPAMAGKRVRLPGFVIPLERQGEQLREFILVPYFGACIHSPPPPANQIVQGISTRPLGKLRTMDAVWVSGTLSLQRVDTPWGKAGYRISVDKVEPYVEPKRKR